VDTYAPHDPLCTQVLLVDDNEPFRRRVGKLIDKLPGFEVLAEVEDGVQAVRLAHELQPDIVVTDVVMPELNGIEVTARIKHDSPTVEVIGLSMHGDDGFRKAMLDAGAMAYLLKDNVLHELPKVLQSIAAARAIPGSLDASIS